MVVLLYTSCERDSSWVAQISSERELEVRICNREHHLGAAVQTYRLLYSVDAAARQPSKRTNPSLWLQRSVACGVSSRREDGRLCPERLRLMATSTKDCTNLPNTGFLCASLAQNELSVWLIGTSNVYELWMKKNEGMTKFVLHDGPSWRQTVHPPGSRNTGRLADIINRYKVA